MTVGVKVAVGVTVGVSVGAAAVTMRVTSTTKGVLVGMEATVERTETAIRRGSGGGGRFTRQKIRPSNTKMAASREYSASLGVKVNGL